MFEIMMLVENIKKYRKKKGVKQNEFAERTMIGIDGGGSKTEFVLFSENGKIWNRVLLSGCNPNTVGLQKAVDTLIMGIDILLRTELEVSGIFIGAAGFGSGNNARAVKACLEKKYPNAWVQCESDIVNVIACGTNSDKCIAAICGTGVAVYASTNGVFRRFGGRGYLLDEGGSGYHIGKDAICAVLDVEDGLETHSVLVDFVQEKLGGTVWKNIQKVYAQNQSYIASFVPCVFRAYENGDRIAERILEKNAEKLARLINLAAERCGVEKNVVASGSVVSQNRVFGEMLKNRLKEGLELEIPDCAPVYGACIMCCRLCGVNDVDFAERFSIQYKELIKC